MPSSTTPGTAGQQNWYDFLVDIVPSSAVGAFVESNVLQVLFVAIIFAVAVGSLGERGAPIVSALERLSEVIFGMVRLVMYLAPVGAFGAMLARRAGPLPRRRADHSYDVRRGDRRAQRRRRVRLSPELPAAPWRGTVSRGGPRDLDLAGPYGWHPELHLSGTGVSDHAQLIRSLSGPVVFDHMARVDLREGIDSAAVRSLLDLLDTGRVWVKLSGVDRVSRQPPPFDDGIELARRLLQHAPERALWGTDFPHPNVSGYMPDDGQLVDLIPSIARDQSER